MPIRCRMNLPPALVQFLASLLAILALAGVARWLGLGPAPQLVDERAAREAAEAAIGGYRPVAVALDRDGKGALLRDAGERILLLRPHGSHFAGRLLGPAASAWIDRGGSSPVLVVSSGERRFGDARLDLDDPQFWVERIGAMGGARHA